MPGPVAEDLHLQFPSKAGYLGISRLNATAVAASAGFNVEELDDLRLAVGEGVAWLLSDDNEGSVDITMNCRDREFRLTATVTGHGIGLPDPDELVHAILGATTDHYEIEIGDGKRSMVLSKKAGDG